MNSPSSEPDWCRLPHDPIGFFGLPLDFDRQSLRRQYCRLIRRYRPEQHPNEFQRIRAAYEVLDVRIRYGMRAFENSGTGDIPWTPNTNTPAASDSTETAVDPVRRGAALHQRLELESPELLYRELSDATHKTAFDYFALAVLSDFVDASREVAFPRWLLAGLRTYPHDRGLHQLLNHYLAGPIPAENLPQLLIMLSQHVAEAFYFPLTERLWQKLLRTRGFERFRTTLDICERNQPGLNIDGRVTFYIQIMRLAIWQATPDWIERSMDFIEENFRHIPYQLESEVDLLVRLQAYVAMRKQFVGENQLRAQMDEALESFFTEDELLSDRRLLECQMSLVQHIVELRSAFPDVYDPTLPLFYSLWHDVSCEAAERNFSEQRGDLTDDLWRARTWALLERIDSLTGSSKLGWCWTLASIGFRAVVFAVGVGAMVIAGGACALFSRSHVLSREYEDLALAFYGMISIGCGIFVGYWADKYINTRWANNFHAAMAWRLYRQLWQPEVFGLIERSHMPIPTMLSFMVSGNAARASSWRWLHHYIQRDYALAVYSTAQRLAV